MARRLARECTVEEFEAWSAAHEQTDKVLEAAVEEGGPRVSLVPNPTSVPIDFIPDEVAVRVPSPAGPRALPFTPEPSRKTSGWSAMRQRLFIEALAQTGSVHLAAKAAGLSARSAYGLRLRSAAFAVAWDNAQQLAVGRLSALAFDRAIYGRVDQIYRNGELFAEKRVPSDRLLMWLLARLDPKRFAAPWERRPDDKTDPQAEAQQSFPACLGALTDTSAE